MENFIKLITEEMTKRHPEANVSTINVNKSMVTLTGLHIAKAGQNIMPTIYLEHFYEAYASGGKSISEICDEIDKIYETPIPDFGDISELLKYENCKGKIIAKVLPFVGNEEFLKDKPYEMVADLAVTYAVANANAEEGAYIDINNHILNMWNVDVSELRAFALENGNEDITFMSMMDMLMSIETDSVPGAPSMDELEEYMECHQNEGMYVLSNTSKHYGAGVLLNTKILDKLEELVGEYYIVPSSIHEVLIVPQGTIELEALREMVVEVNANEVAPNERLSDSVYGYDTLKKSIVNLTSPIVSMAKNVVAKTMDLCNMEIIENL